MAGAATQRESGELRVLTIVTEPPWKVNCYLITHVSSGESVIVDPGGSLEELREAIDAAGGKLRHILLTHAHHDHVGAVAALSREHGLPALLHRDDGRLLRHAPMYAMRFAGKEIEAPTERELFDGDPPATVGGHPVTAVHTPGHTKGSVCFRIGNFAFTGDTLLLEKIGRTDLPGGDIDVLRNSVTGLLSTLDEADVLLPGHGAAWSVDEARRWWDSVISGATEPEQMDTHA